MAKRNSLYPRQVLPSNVMFTAVEASFDYGYYPRPVAPSTTNIAPLVRNSY